MRSERVRSGAVCHALLYITICELKTADLGPLQSIKPLLLRSCTYLLLTCGQNYSTQALKIVIKLGGFANGQLSFVIYLLFLDAFMPLVQFLVVVKLCFLAFLNSRNSGNFWVGIHIDFLGMIS